VSLDDAATATPFILLVLFAATFLAGVVLMGFATRWHRMAMERTRQAGEKFASVLKADYVVPVDSIGRRPTLWIAIHTPDAAGVFSALGLDHPQPGHWTHCGPGSGRMFVSVPVNGWTLVCGDGIPDPVEDVDRCFRFLTNLSTALGHVHLFSASAILDDHAWVRVESGRVIRAYTWAAGHTLWNQGEMTNDERQLGLKCFAYGENTDANDWRLRERVIENLAKVPLLAARWSIDPAELESVPSTLNSGVAGFAGSIHS
jgi:hypothetical protein